MPKPEQESSEGPVFNDLPKLYFNSFSIGYSPVDVMIRVAQNGSPTVEINMAFATAKQVALALNNAISEIESQLNYPIEISMKKEASVK